MAFKEGRTSQSPITLRNSAHRSNSFVGTIDFDGLRDVPLGPRHAGGVFDTRRVGSAPHIFISKKDLPAQANLIRHLNGLLKSLKPSETYIDKEDGWYLVYDNSDQGREKLRTCYRRFNKEYLFDEYQLVMEHFPDGMQANSQRDRDHRYGADTTDNIPARYMAATMTSPNLGRFRERESTYPNPFNDRGLGNISIAPDWRDERVDSTRVPDDEREHMLSTKAVPSKHAHAPTSNEVTSSQFSHRSDHDDSASLASGVTPSDGSRSKRCRCHVCKGEEGVHGLSSLIRCATCPRRYHRRCHKEPPIPLELPNGNHWICRSCARKGRVWEEARQGDLLVPTSSPKPASSQPQSQREQLGSNPAAGDVQLDGPASPVPDIRDSSALPDKADTTQRSTELLGRKATDSSTRAVRGTNDEDEAPPSDADDLVERSFASAEKKAKPQPQSLRSSKFKMTRTKLPAPAPRVTSEQAGLAGNVATTESFSEIQQTKGDVEGPAVRPSAAQLRGLAMNRHLATQADSADFRLSNQEQLSSALPLTSLLNPTASTEPMASVHSEVREVANGTGKDQRATNVSCVFDQLEIPESPDDVRRGAAKKMEETPDPRLPAKCVSTVERLQKEDTAKHPTNSLSTTTSNPRSGQSLSKRSRGPAFTVCPGCMKKTPVGPSGKAKICTTCKKKRGSTEGQADMKDASSITHGLSSTPREHKEANQAFAASTPTAAVHTSKRAKLALSGEEYGVANRPKHDVLVDSRDSPGRIPQPGARQKSSGGKPDQDESAMIDKDGDFEMASTAPVEKGLTITADGDTGLNLDTSAEHPLTPGSPIEPVHSPKSQRPNLPAIPPTQDAGALPTDKLERIRTLLGDSFDRPKGSRAILVGMALCSAPGNRLQAKSITHWIGDNIPTYRHGEGNWYARIVSQLSQGRVTESGHGLRYWRDGGWDPGEEELPGRRWYQLLPEREEMMWKWCPVLKEPLAPKQHNIVKAAKANKKRRTAPETQTVLPSGEKLLDERAKLERHALGPMASDASGHNIQHDAHSKWRGSGQQIPTVSKMQAGPEEISAQTTTTGVVDQNPSVTFRADVREYTPNKGDITSDDEPLSHMRQRSGGPRPIQSPSDIVQQDTPINTEMEELPDAESDTSVVDTATQAEDINGHGRTEAPEANDKQERPGLVKLFVPSLRLSLMHDNCLESYSPWVSHNLPVRNEGLGINLATTDYSVTSFFDEWPEYRSVNSFDKQEKLEEIRTRPTRKQMFGKQASHSRLRPQGTVFVPPIIPNNVSPVKRSRPFVDATVHDPYPWENPDVYPTRKEYKTLEDFFDLPPNCIPIISDGQLAYRDGTRTDDGRLPRAREVFKP